MKIHPNINEVAIIIKRVSEGGERKRYRMTARVISPMEQINAHGEGYDMLKTFEDMLNTLESQMMKTKTGPHTARRGERDRGHSQRQQNG
jgi:ribosome-associated translation inhibitor RaiA